MSETVRAAGGVIRRDTGNGSEIVVIHRASHDDWTLPKGKVEEGESDEAAAVREIEEETGLTCTLGPELPSVHYADAMGRPKRVRYWLAKPVGVASAIADRQVDEVRSLPPAEARALLTFDRDRSVIDASLALDRPVYLVRHALAGSSSTWRQDDSLRPLTERGRRQATGLAAQLGHLNVGAFVSSPALRCRQTVEPMAEEVGAVVTEVAELADEVSTADLDRFLRSVPGPVVACSHGEPIEAILARWASAGVSVDGPQRDGAPLAKKGSTWVIERRAGEPVGLRYVAPPRDRVSWGLGRG